MSAKLKDENLEKVSGGTYVDDLVSFHYTDHDTTMHVSSTKKMNFILYRVAVESNVFEELKFSCGNSSTASILMNIPEGATKIDFHIFFTDGSEKEYKGIQF